MPMANECQRLGLIQTHFVGIRRTENADKQGILPLTHLLREQGVASSNLAAPTNKINGLRWNYSV